MEDKYIKKTFTCDCCGQKLLFKIEKNKLEEISRSQLMNFVIMHADDHTLILSLDARGEIRRKKVATIGEVENNSLNQSYQKIKAISEAKNLTEAFNIWLKNC